MFVIGGVTIGGNGFTPSFAAPKEAPKATPVDALKPVSASSSAGAEEKPKEGVSVTFSGAALIKAREAKAADQASDTSDIEESGLPENIQNILKMIREIKKQIAEKTAELQAVMSDKSLTPEQAMAKASGLQSAISALSAALTAANASLVKAMKDSGLSPEQSVKAGGLAAK